MQGHSEALSDLFNVCDKAGLHQLIHLDWSCAYKANAVILQKEKVWAKAARRPFEVWY